MALPAGDQYISNVVCLMHMDDTSLTDFTGKTVTLAGNVARSATQSKFGGYSAVFDGTGDYLTLADSTAWDFTVAFCVEMWVYVSAFSASGTAFALQQSGGGAGGFELYSDNSGTLYFRRSSSVLVVTSSAGALSTGGWHHLAATWDGGTYKVFVDGTSVGSGVSSTAPANVSGVLKIGAYPGTSAYDMNGYIDEVRITNGVARYTADFTAPTVAFPETYLRISGTTKNSGGTLSPSVVRVMRCSDSALAGSVLSDYSTGEYVVTALDNTPHYAVCHADLFDQYWSSTVLLMHMNDTGLTDEKGKAITLAGGAARSATQSKFGGYSAYFDGTGDYLTTPDSADFAFASGDFTIECYFKQEATGGTYALAAQRTTTTSSYSFAFQITGSTVTFICSTSGTATTHTVTAAYTQETSNWHHAAAVRSGTLLTVFIDGTPGTSVSISTTALANSSAVLSIGGDETGSSNQFNGYIDDLRITKGVARYTLAFTPHTSAHPHAYSGATENALIYDNITPY